MSNLELLGKYLVLEQRYRALEERIAALEAEIEVGMQIGTYEKIKNTSASLFILRKDREKLSEELNIPITEYDTAKTLIEDEIERVIYENADIIRQFTDGEEIASPVTEVAKVIAETKAETKTPVVTPKVSTPVTAETPVAPVTGGAPIMSMSTVAAPKRRTRRTKAEIEAEKVAEATPVEVSVAQAPEPTAPDNQGFEELDAALNMFNN